MQPCLIILIFTASTALAWYHEKTRYDRSVHEEGGVTNAEDSANEKQWSFTDDVTQFVAYKSRTENDCYLENLEQTRTTSRKKRQPRTLFASTALTKFEAWRLAGGRIVDFCNGRSIVLLQATRPVPGQALDPFLNEIPIDENDIFPKRVADVVLTPLKARTKRHIQLEQRKKLNANFNHIRQRRQTTQFRGKFRGQTQSQYLNLGNEQKEGKAEAEATQQSSRAVVSGSRGIGQAQSMSSGGTDCEDCPGYPGYPGIEGLPGIRIPSAGTDGTPGVGITRPGAGPGDVIPGRQLTYPVAIPGRGETYPGTLPGIGGVYPGGVQPGIVTEGDRIYPGGIRPGTVTPGVDRKYPAGVQPGTITPGGVRPGVVMPGADGIYPGAVSPGTVTTGGNGIYLGGVQPGRIRPEGGIYPGGVQPGAVRPGADGTYPAGVQPGAVRPGADGTYPAGVQPGVVRPGVDGTYPGGVQPGAVRPGGEGIYPPGTLITGDRGVYPGVQVPRGGVPVGVGTGIGIYPGGIQPVVQPGQAAYSPSGASVTTSVTTSAITGTGAYPGGIVPAGLPAGTYAGGVPGTYPGTGVYPGGVRPGTVPGTGVPGTYPGGIIPGGTIGGQVVYPAETGVVYPGGLAPGTLPGRGQVPGTVTTTGPVAGGDAQVVTYPAGRPTDGDRVLYPSGVLQPGRTPEEIPGTQVVYPGGTYPAGTIPVTYPGGTQQLIPPSGTLYPGQETYPSGGEGRVQIYPGQYPGAGIPGATRIPGGTGVPGGAQYPVATVGGQTVEGTGVPGRYPGQYPSGQEVGQYPGRRYPGIGGIAGEVPQYYTQPGVPGVSAGVADDGAESQASSSVQQVDSGTQASASAQGKYGSGTAQSQVTGTYSGSGSFSAQAGTSDANKSAQTEVNGGEQGASSNAQGVGGYGKSQAQVQLDSDSGATSTGAQSSGWNHGTNSQVQASSKGGMADAQANGEGSTSSQAQIGFQPYLKNEAEEAERRAVPFRGSGTASAQSGTHRGQSQSQLQGSFQYGITYTGAAQAGSGSGAASSRKPFTFNITDTDLFKPFKPQPPLSKPANAEESSAQAIPPARSNYENGRGLQSSSTSKQIVVVNSKDDSNDRKTSSTAKSRKDDVVYDEEYDEEYDEDDYPAAPPPDSRGIQEKFPKALPSSSSSPTLSSNSNPTPSSSSNPTLSKTVSQQSRTQSQTIRVVKGNQYDLHVSQDSNVQPGDTLQPGQSVGGYAIPPELRGKVISTAGVETIAQGDGKSQSQTVSVVPKDLNNTRTPVIETRSLQTSHERHIGRHTSSGKDQRSSSSHNASSDRYVKPIPAAKPSYYTVTNSFAGKMNGSNEPRKYEHRYYTKSSTCGYFTFSCNVVYGSNGRTKICKPRMPTYPNGTPMRC
ncbi:hypothetical protein DMN91_009085 [Ooceraea biroi]|uniref:Uncharacterized protein n=1 Tax=Ooceraea biroi TaxID=2015173 RepID=A0A3L8DFQ6_OOCBI|nr:hypothetical protein DMN91_009085 [Ooceraea biroi]